MADRKQSSEFLGGGPKFNSVGRDTRGADGAEEPVVPVAPTGYWLRIAGVAVAVLLLGALLFYLNGQNLGKTNVPPGHGGRTVSPDTDKPTSDPNLK